MDQVSLVEMDLEAGPKTGESTGSEEEKDFDLCSAQVPNGAEDLDQSMTGTSLTEEESRLQKSFWDKVYAVKKKNKNTKKPPLPPKGPSLDAVDKRLIKALVEQAKYKRLQKMRVANEASSISCYRILAFVIAAFSVGFLVYSYGNYKRSRGFEIYQGSPGPAIAAEQGFMSLQFDSSLSPSAGNGPN